MDLENFLDTVTRSMIMEILSRKIKDNKVLSCIQKFLNVGIMDRKMFIKNEVGVPQVGPISPLLENVMLNELDQELDKWDYRLVRYPGVRLCFNIHKEQESYKC